MLENVIWKHVLRRSAWERGRKYVLDEPRASRRMCDTFPPQNVIGRSLVGNLHERAVGSTFPGGIRAPRAISATSIGLACPCAGPRCSEWELRPPTSSVHPQAGLTVPHEPAPPYPLRISVRARGYTCYPRDRVPQAAPRPSGCAREQHRIPCTQQPPQERCPCPQRSISTR